MSKVSERSITHGKKNQGKKMIFANKISFCRSERCREPAGSCSRRWWRRQPGCLTSTTDPTFSGDARNVEEFVFKYLLLHRRITHSFKEGEEFRKDEDIHKWGANLRSIGDIFNLRSLASAQISLDMLRRQASIGELYNPRSHSWADFSPFRELPFQQLCLQGHPVSWEGEAFNLRKKRRGVAGQRY